MDVTALLNGNSFAVDQQVKEGEVLRLPARSRTPWDAGGYSLPLNATIAIAIPNPSSKNVDRASSEAIHGNEANDSRTSDTPTSPIHKFTDSRSSLSSFTSSLPSTTHSRLSSISTVNSTHTLSNSLAGHSLSPKSTTHQVVEMSNSLPSEGDARPATSANESQAHDGPSPTKSLDTLALIAEHYQLGNLHESSNLEFIPGKTDLQREVQLPGGRRSTTLRGNKDVCNVSLGRNNPRIENSINGNNEMGDYEVRNHKDDKESSSWVNSKKDMGSLEVGDGKNDTESKSWVNVPARPASPSDSLLIKRTTIPTLTLHTKGEHLDQSTLLYQHYLRVDSDFQNEGLVNTKNHKRALSAPNLAIQQNSANMAESTRRGRQAEQTPPYSQHPEYSSPPPFGYSAPDTPPPATIDDAEGEPVCMYITDCDTGSQQRKAISHIFGRNKMCTRLVPQHIWVHLCRKHYQRSRYRNATAGYAKVQCDLVQEQIRRIHDWSVRNLNSGHGPFVQNWTLALRKREQKRIEDQDGTKRKRSTFVQDEDDNVHRDEIGYPAPQTAVPDWLLALVGGEFTTRGVLEIFNRLHRHIMDYVVPLPDIEILPNIVLGQDDAKQSGDKNLHQRAQSLSASHESSFRDHVPKRRRQNEVSNSPISRRPTYPDMSEHQTEGKGYSHQQPSYQSPLPAPRPQRLNIESMAAHLESDNTRGIGRRPTHHRSQSDIGFARGSSNHSEYLERGIDMHDSRHFHSYDRSDANHSSMHSQRGYGASGSSVHAGSTDPLLPSAREMNQPPVAGHSRHYSSSLDTHASHSIPPIAASRNPQSSLSSYNRSNRPSIPQIKETKETRDLYSSRR